ncbi:hypothetical protein [Hymenobacter yonginensis]|uniref:Uncharacterized protein n=1 Tax=Hymenobacter yonginensis TaxID=748197 RepID=A0ABY7PTL4_9BACT|nr:hypothetical protein [Hymenobacter yonginensis]WBO86278.1 hypothetical protein O9Z63_08445 [Hymenobacter yonginensis]
MAVTIRRNDVRASNLLLVNFILGLVAEVYQFKHAFSSHFLGTLVFLAFNLLPGLVFVWLIRQGYHWAKVYFIFLFLVGLAVYAPKLLGQQLPISTILITLACAIPQAWAVLILLKDLFRKPKAGDAGVAEGGHNRGN